MASIYLAGRFANKALLQDVRADLQEAGHTVTSRWLDGDAASETDSAYQDLEDIDRCDTLVLWADEPQPGERPMQGALIELGYAIALARLFGYHHKRIFILDELKKRTVFFSMPQLHFIENWQDLTEQLEVLEILGPGPVHWDLPLA